MAGQAIAILDRRVSLDAGEARLLLAVAFEAEVGDAVFHHLGMARGVRIVAAYTSLADLDRGMDAWLRHYSLDRVMALRAEFVPLGHKLNLSSRSQARMTGLTVFLSERSMLELIDQFGLVGGMGAVAGCAVGALDHAPFVGRACFLDTRIVTPLAEVGHRLDKIIALVGAVRIVAGRTFTVFNRLMYRGFLEILGHILVAE